MSARQRLTITWRDLNCPDEPGTYDYEGLSVQVSASDVQAAKDNPDAICSIESVTRWTVVTVTQPDA